MINESLLLMNVEQEVVVYDGKPQVVVVVEVEEEALVSFR